jgi:RNA polymerase sigma-70 factor, ECF subfamily
MVESEPDEKLLVETAQRDPRHFADLYRANFDRVYAYVARRVTPRADAQDLTAQVFQQALANLGRFEWRGVPFAAWLYRIAANAITDHYLRTVRDLNMPANPEPAHEEHASVERRASLYRAVRELPVDQRRVIEMRFAEDRSIADIARILRRSEGAVKQLQFRALGSLRARLGEHDV